MSRFSNRWTQALINLVELADRHDLVCTFPRACLLFNVSGEELLDAYGEAERENWLHAVLVDGRMQLKPGPAIP